MTEWLHFDFSLSCIGEGNGNPLQCSCLENPRDRGALWAAVYRVIQSQTWLSRLSSSSSLISYPWLHPLVVSSLFHLTMFYSSSSEFSVVRLHCHFNMCKSKHLTSMWQGLSSLLVNTTRSPVLRWHVIPPALTHSRKVSMECFKNDRIPLNSAHSFFFFLASFPSKTLKFPSEINNEGYCTISKDHQKIFALV